MDRDELLENPLEIGKRIGAACGYSTKKRGQIAKELGRDERTLRSYVGGNLGDYNTPALRETLIRDVERITGCPPEIFGLSQSEPDGAARLERKLREEWKADLAQAKVERAEELEPLEDRLSQLEHAVRTAK